MQHENSRSDILRKGGTMKKYTIEKTVPDYLEVQVDINSIKASLDLAYDDLAESINADEVSENAWEHIKEWVADNQLLMTQEEFDNLINHFDKKLILQTADSAKSLILKLEEFKSMIDLSAKHRYVYTVCRYVQDLAGEFHSFYNSNRVISDDKELMKSRVALVYAIKIVLKNALDILAVNAPERM